MRLTGIITQGASRAGKAEYARIFRVAYSLDGREFMFYKDEKHDREKVGAVVTGLLLLDAGKKDGESGAASVQGRGSVHGGISM